MNVQFQQEFISHAIKRIKDNLLFVEICFDQIEEEHIWQKPNMVTNAIGNQVLHLCGNLAQYTLVTLQNQKDNRNRDAEFKDRGIGKDEVFSLLKTTVSKSIAVIEKTSESEWQRVRSVQGFQFSGVGCVLHAVEHFSYHTGQIALQTKMIINKPLHFWDGFDLNVKDNNNGTF